WRVLPWPTGREHLQAVEAARQCPAEMSQHLYGRPFPLERDAAALLISQTIDRGEHAVAVRSDEVAHVRQALASLFHHVGSTALVRLRFNDHVTSVRPPGAGGDT